MRVMVHLVVGGAEEIVLEGEAPIFGNHVDYTKGFDTRLRDVGFWLNDWRYAGHSGSNNKNPVFVSWANRLYVVTLG